VFDDTRTGTAGGEGAREVGNPPEKKDETPRRLQQWADHVPGTSEATLIRAA